VRFQAMILPTVSGAGTLRSRGWRTSFWRTEKMLNEPFFISGEKCQ